jgi:hypothetical protein
VFADFDALRAINPLGRIPSLVLDGGDVLIDSAAILDWLDQTVGPERALVPPAGAERRRALRRIALATGAIDKVGAAAYERMIRPPALRWPEWIPMRKCCRGSSIFRARPMMILTPSRRARTFRSPNGSDGWSALTNCRRSSATRHESNPVPNVTRGMAWHRVTSGGRRDACSFLLFDPDAVGQGRSSILQEARLASPHPKSAATIPSAATGIPCACSCRPAAYSSPGGSPPTA